MKKLTRDEMKKIKGGLAKPTEAGSCCWHNDDWSAYLCNISKTSAQTYATQYAMGNGAGNHGHWCCESC